MRRPPPRYPYSRVAVAGLFLLILAWLAFSMAFSIGANVFWEYEREVAIPVEPRVTLDSPAKLLAAAKGLRIFGRDLSVNAQRFLAHFRQEPEQTTDVWESWRKQWRQDLTTFGRRYAFDDERAVAGNGEAAAMARVYRRLLTLEDAYGQNFTQILHLHEANQQTLNEELEGRIDALSAQVGE